MSEEQDQKRGFKVEDRRRFSESGEAREEAPASTTEAAAQAPPEAKPEAVQPPPLSPPSDAERAPRQAHEINFSTFVLSLSTQALAYLGEIPSLMDGQIGKDLIAAKELIDILGVLDEKTKGNLDAAEAALLHNVLYDLRLKYVEHARQG